MPHGRHIYNEIELELELIQTQMSQKPMLQAEGECACVAQMESRKSGGVSGQVP